MLDSALLDNKPGCLNNSKRPGSRVSLLSSFYHVLRGFQRPRYYSGYSTRIHRPYYFPEHVLILMGTPIIIVLSEYLKSLVNPKVNCESRYVSESQRPKPSVETGDSLLTIQLTNHVPVLYFACFLGLSACFKQVKWSE